MGKMRSGPGINLQEGGRSAGIVLPHHSVYAIIPVANPFLKAAFMSVHPNVMESIWASKPVNPIGESAPQ